MANKAIFLDRDNTIIEDPGYINNPDQVKLLDGVSPALIELRNMGFLLVIVSNQSGIARGIVTEKKLGEIHEKLSHLLSKKGAYLDKIYFCPYHPDGIIEKYRKPSNLRKPSPGMLLQAGEELDIDLTKSWMIGDSECDIQAGQKAGCQTIQIETPSRVSFTMAAVKADFKAVNLKEATNIIKKQSKLDSTKMHIKSSSVKHSKSQSQTDSQHQKTAIKSIKTDHVSAASVTDGDIHRTSLSPETSNENTILLKQILERIKRSQRTDMFSDFSVMRMFAGILQVMVLFSLSIALLFLISHRTNHQTIMTILGFAAVLQIMSLTFYVMRDNGK